ncbi:MAG TPA: hypothetical protein VHO70_07945 [Chitinispirillaceae bacterium]|nr:hypothetical protein [Chitinispirillaceae bacterium]
MSCGSSSPPAAGRKEFGRNIKGGSLSIAPARLKATFANYRSYYNGVH